MRSEKEPKKESCPVINHGDRLMYWRRGRSSDCVCMVLALGSRGLRLSKKRCVMCPLYAPIQGDHPQMWRYMGGSVRAFVYYPYGIGLEALRLLKNLEHVFGVHTKVCEPSFSEYGHGTMKVVICNVSLDESGRVNWNDHSRGIG